MSKDEQVMPAPRSTAMVAINADDLRHLRAERDAYVRMERERNEARRAIEAPRIGRFRDFTRAFDAWIAGDESEAAWAELSRRRVVLDANGDMEGGTK